MPLRSRVATVTGGGRGVGRARALALTEAGARIIVSAARKRAEIEAVAEEAERRWGRARIVPMIADVTREMARVCASSRTLGGRSSQSRAWRVLQRNQCSGRIAPEDGRANEALLALLAANLGLGSRSRLVGTALRRLPLL
jgi:NAD(P)-dependent dehydrogenase (short-subunit alcohol dehydrogenase family)